MRESITSTILTCVWTRTGNRSRPDVVAILTTNQAQWNSHITQHHLVNLLHPRVKKHARFIVKPWHVRTKRRGWREALTSKMLRSVVIDILIALLVILFWTVLFPLSSPRSPNLFDESQEAVHAWLPGRRCAASSRADSSAALQIGGAWMTLRKPGDLDTLPSSLAPRAHQGREFSCRRGKHNRDMGVPWWDLLI